jgi:hypothetical protein
MSNQNEWGVPDWCDATAYPQPDDLPGRLWRWEFIRRMPDYRDAWDKASKVEYEIECRMAEKAGRDKARILQPDDLHFVVNSAVWDNPMRYHGLIKYNINPFYNPRVAIPRIFRDGPSVMHLPVSHYGDEHGGYFLSQPKTEYRREPVGIRPGWTIVHFDLAEPLDMQLDRAKTRLQQVQESFLKKVGLGFPDRLKQKSARRQRKDMWPSYLRVLDARDTGASYEAIGRKLKGIDEGDIWKMNRQDADKLLSQLERARIDAKKWHEAALKVANNWAGLIARCK